MEFNSKQITEIIKCYQFSKCDWLYGERADSAMFTLLLTETHGYVCEGCRVKDKCTPVHFRRIENAIHNRPGATRRSYAKTNAQLAEELGISKRQVAKRRKRGEL